MPVCMQKYRFNKVSKNLSQRILMNAFSNKQTKKMKKIFRRKSENIRVNLFSHFYNCLEIFNENRCLLNRAFSFKIQTKKSMCDQFCSRSKTD